jgi:hypothetical protein
MLSIKKELMKNNSSSSISINKTINSQSRKYHTSSSNILNNSKRSFLIIFLILRLITRIISYIIMFNILLIPIEFSISPKRTLMDHVIDALNEAADQEVLEDEHDLIQDAYHEAAELEAEYQNTEGLLQDIAYFTGQTIEEVTHQLINENSELFNPDEILSSSSPNIQVPNNSFENDSEMNMDMEYYINSTDSDSEIELDVIQEMDDEDSDIELTDYNSVSSTNNSPNSSIHTDVDSIFDSFIPLIFFLRNKLP